MGRRSGAGREQQVFGAEGVDGGVLDAVMSRGRAGTGQDRAAAASLLSTPEAAVYF